MCVNEKKPVCKAALPEWSGWLQYQQKHGARARNIEKGPRLKPFKDGRDEFDVNSALLMRKSYSEGKVNCALTISDGKQGHGSGIGLSFLERFSTKNAVYDKSDLKRL